MELSRLQRIYHKHIATYNPPKESVSIVSANEIRRTYFFSCKRGNGGQHCLVSMDSDLEAFSRYPARGSVAVLAFQLAAFTKYAN